MNRRVNVRHFVSLATKAVFSQRFPAPSLWSRTIDRPGGRFWSKAIVCVPVLALIAVAVWRWRRRATLR